MARRIKGFAKPDKVKKQQPRTHVTDFSEMEVEVAEVVDERAPTFTMAPPYRKTLLNKDATKIYTFVENANSRFEVEGQTFNNSYLLHEQYTYGVVYVPVSQILPNHHYLMIGDIPHCLLMGVIPVVSDFQQLMYTDEDHIFNLTSTYGYKLPDVLVRLPKDEYLKETLLLGNVRNFSTPDLTLYEALSAIVPQPLATEDYAFEFFGDAAQRKAYGEIAQREMEKFDRATHIYWDMDVEEQAAATDNVNDVEGPINGDGNPPSEPPLLWNYVEAALARKQQAEKALAREARLAEQQAAEARRAECEDRLRRQRSLWKMYGDFF